MITVAEIDGVTEACRVLPEPAGTTWRNDFLINLVATVVDFQTHTTVVERAINHFRDQVGPGLGGVEDLVALMETWPATREGNTALALHLWGYRMWTRAQMLRDLVAYFAGVGVTTQEGLGAWARATTFADFKGKVPGLGRAVYQWLVMRQGVDTAKPDVHVHRFLESALGRRVSDADGIEVLSEAAWRLGRPATRLDWAIWEARTRAVPSSLNTPAPSPPSPTETPREEDHMVTFLDDDAGYRSWLLGHPDGFVLNAARHPSPDYLVVHRARCWSIDPTRPGAVGKTWTGDYRKTCAEDLPTLTRWAATIGPPTACGLCQPPL